MRKLLCAATALCALVGAYSPARAEIDVTPDLTMGGRLRQGMTLAYGDYAAGGPTLGQALYLGEITSSWRPNSQLTVTTDLWIRGDFYPEIGGDLTAPATGAAWNTPKQLGRFGYALNKTVAMPSGLALPTNPPYTTLYGTTDNRILTQAKFNEEMLREAAVKWSDSGDRVGLKVGKFVRAWGQSDGIRLLDVLHAQDFRQKFIFAEADEARIPSWMMAADLKLDKLGVGAPLEAVGLGDPRMELIYMPEYHHNRFIINNDTPSSNTNGGLYGISEPMLINPASGYGIPFAGANLHDRNPHAMNWKEPTLGARLKFDTLGGEGTLNALHGYQEFFILKLTGGEFVVGNPYFNQGQALAVQHLSVKAVEAAANLALLPNVANGPAVIQNGVFGAASGGACSVNLSCSLNADFDLDYRYRRDLIGFSYTRDMVELPMGPKAVSPVVRMEGSYEFNKPFNRSVVNTVSYPAALGAPAPANYSIAGTASGSGALLIDPSRAVARRNQASAMVGFDYFLWLPFIQDQESSFFTSLQVFTVVTPNGKDLLFQAPYAAYMTTVNSIQNYVTLLVDKTFDHGRLGWNTLGVIDIQNHGRAVRQRLDFNYFGDNWRPRIELSHFDAAPERGVIGFMQHADNVEFSVTFQF